MTDLCIVTNPIAKRQNCESLFNCFRLLKAFFNSLAVKSTISKFSNTNLRGKDLFDRCVCNMFFYATTTMKIFNPSVSIKNITFHNSLVIKVNITISGTIIITMFHHLIILFTLFCFRPNAC